MSLEINSNNFDTNLNSGSLFVVDVWTTTCTSCKTYAPIFDTVASEKQDVIMGKMNGVENREIASRYGIRSVPTTLFLKNGQLLEQKVGPLTKDQLLNEVEKLSV